MNKIIQKLFGETTKGIADIVDRFVQTKEEKHKANQEVQQLFQSFEIEMQKNTTERWKYDCLLYTSPSPRDKRQSRMPSSA